MRLINNTALARGAALIDYAYSDGGKRLSLQAPDYVGLVAAYLNRGLYSGDIEQELGNRLHPDIGHLAKVTFDLFDDWNGKGLWLQGPATNDIAFMHPTLAKRYPAVSACHSKAFPKLDWYAESAEDVSF